MKLVLPSQTLSTGSHSNLLQLVTGKRENEFLIECRVRGRFPLAYMN